MMKPPYPGYAGYPADSNTGGHALGNGYRLYLPYLARFTAPDDWSPYTKAGLNAYAYCMGQPVGMSDPSGHFNVPILEQVMRSLLDRPRRAAADTVVDASADVPRRPAGDPPRPRGGLLNGANRRVRRALDRMLQELSADRQPAPAENVLAAADIRPRPGPPPDGQGSLAVLNAQNSASHAGGNSAHAPAAAANAAPPVDTGGLAPVPPYEAAMNAPLPSEALADYINREAAMHQAATLPPYSFGRREPVGVLEHFVVGMRQFAPGLDSGIVSDE